MSDALGSLSALEVYERWAPTYPPRPHNPLMRAEQKALLAKLPAVAGCRVLDLACGSGRYTELLSARGADVVVSADFSQAMLARVASGHRVRATLSSLPFASGCFDLVVSGLAIGHASDLQICLNEIARVLRPGGGLHYSDFHPDAAQAGLTRSFRDDTNRSFSLPPSGFGLDAHREAARRAGLAIESIEELRVGQEISEPFSGSEEFYRRWQGVALVFVVRANR